MQSLSPPLDHYKNLVRDTFDAYRKRQISKLISSPLAQSEALRACLLLDELDTPDLRGRLLQSLLRWVIAHLHPGGIPDYTADDWRIYTILHDYYQERRPITLVSQTIGVSVPSVYYWLQSAIDVAGIVLRAVFEHPHEIGEVRRYALADRYRCHASPDEQRLMEILVAFDAPIQVERFALLPELPFTSTLLRRKEEQWQQIVNELQQEVEWSYALAQLTSKSWVQRLAESNREGRVVLLPELRQALLSIIPPATQRRSQLFAALYNITQNDFLSAAKHLRQAGEEAAALCILHEQQYSVEKNSIIPNYPLANLAEINSSGWNTFAQQFSTEHNVNNIFSLQAKHQLALADLQESLAIASRTDDLALQGDCHKAIGSEYFTMQRYVEAVEHYQKAYILCKKLGRKDMQCFLCLALAKGYATLGDTTQAIAAFQEGITLVPKLNLAKGVDEFLQLAKEYPCITWPIDQRRRRWNQVQSYLEINKSITCKAYAALANISERQAGRDLIDWVRQNKLHQHGKARSVKYELHLSMP